MGGFAAPPGLMDTRSVNVGNLKKREIVQDFWHMKNEEDFPSVVTFKN
jgi:hypothetical protein